MPVGVASSPSPPANTCHSAASSATAGAGTGSSPCAVVTRPAPNATGPAVRSVTARSCSAAQTPTTSAMESQAPTSWKCTSSVVVPCTCASATARRAKAASADARTGSARGACSMRRRTSRHVRCAWSSSLGVTWIRVARIPARVTCVCARRTSPGTTASTAARTVLNAAPPSTRAASSMSPAMPADASTHAALMGATDAGPRRLAARRVCPGRRRTRRGPPRRGPDGRGSPRGRRLRECRSRG